MSEKRKIAAFVAVHNAEGAILMGQNEDGQWCAPGGKAEKDESPEEAAARELREEAGIGVETMGYIGAGRGKGPWDVYVFKATVDNVSPNADGDPDEEFKDFRWVKQSELKDIDLKYGEHDVVLGLLGWGPRQPDTDGVEVEDHESSVGLAKAVNLRKALADIKPGQTLNSGRINYSHVLPAETQKNYKILIHEQPANEHGVVPYEAQVYHRSGAKVGSVKGMRRLNEEAGKRYALLSFSHVEPAHRGQGLGQAAYEAFLAHGRNAGVTHLRGDDHSTAASRIHQLLGLKHGLDYKAMPSTLDPAEQHALQSEFGGGDAPSANWNFKHGPYEYALKSEPANLVDGSHANILDASDSKIKDFMTSMHGNRLGTVSSEYASKFMARPDVSDDTKADVLNAWNGHQGFLTGALKPEIVDTMVRRNTGTNGKLNSVAAHTLETYALNTAFRDSISGKAVKAFGDYSPENRNVVMVSKNLIEKLPTPDASHYVNTYLDTYSTAPPKETVGAPNLSSDVMKRIGDRLDPTYHDKELHHFLSNPALPADVKEHMWGRMKNYHVQQKFLSNAGVTAPMAKKFLAENEIGAGNDNAINQLAQNPGLGPDFWEPEVKPGGAVDKHLRGGGYLYSNIFDKIKSPEAWKDVARLPLQGQTDDNDGNFSTMGFAKAAPDEAVRDFHRRGFVREGEAGVGDRLYELGATNPKLLQVRTGTDKLRALRDSLTTPKHVRQLRTEGTDIGSLGLSRHLDPQGNLSAEAVQQVIDAKPPKTYGHERGTWDGEQMHSDAMQKVFQLTLPPETLREIRRQGLRPAYDKLLAQTKEHPRHDTRGIGWVRYTEKPDGIHIDEIQSDFGHNMGGNLKNLDSRVAEGKISQRQRDAMPKTDEFARLHQLMWGNEQPHKILHEAFMEHLRTKKKVGKEVHMWQLAPKMGLAGQSINRPAPVHMKQTYDELPKQAGYKPSEYGRLTTQTNHDFKAATIPNFHEGTYTSAAQPTWQSVVRKFELDADFYVSENHEMLQKGARHLLWGLAAATALNSAPHTPKAPEPESLQSVQPDLQSHMPPVQASMMPKAAIQPWNPQGLRPELVPIAHLESSFGKNMNHAAHSGGDFQTAYGAVGFKPATAHETYKKSKALQAAYPGLEDPQAFTSAFKADPAFYNATASRHFGNLMTHLGGDPARAAFAWRWGIGAAEAASPDDVNTDTYVVKYKALAAARAARAHQAIEAQFPQKVAAQ